MQANSLFDKLTRLYSIFDRGLGRVLRQKAKKSSLGPVLVSGVAGLCVLPSGPADRVAGPV